MLNNNACSEAVDWSDKIQFRIPPAGGSDEMKFLAYGDMGKAPRDASTEHYIQVRVGVHSRVCVCVCVVVVVTIINLDDLSHNLLINET